mgnify:CR=1 FL=1
MSSHFYAMLFRMRYIERWGLMHNTRPENLSEHTLDVAILTHALCVLGNQRFHRSYDCGQGVLLALYHDCSEILTGDLPTPIKYHDPAIRTSYKMLERQANRQLLELLPGDLKEEYAPCLLPQGQEDLLALVKGADKLSALIKCIQEEGLGNREFTQARQGLEQALREMHLPEVDCFMQEFLPSYGLSLDELQQGEAPSETC